MLSGDSSAMHSASEAKPLDFKPADASCDQRNEDCNT